jgi:hypothetical protein
MCVGANAAGLRALLDGKSAGPYGVSRALQSNRSPSATRKGAATFMTKNRMAERGTACSTSQKGRQGPEGDGIYWRGAGAGHSCNRYR